MTQAIDQYFAEMRNTLEASDFTKSLLLVLEDGSFVKFNYCFSEEKEDYVLIFTEHCGYHKFWKKTIVKLVELPCI